MTIQTPTPPDPEGIKRSLEEEKIRLEIKELHRRWYQRPDYLSSIVALLIGIGTLVAAWTNGFFDVNSKRLENQRHDLERDVSAFKGERDALTAQNDGLRRDLKTLQTAKQTLSRRNTQLAGQNYGLQNRIEVQLKRTDQLVKQIAVTELKVNLRILASIGTRIDLNDPLVKRTMQIVEQASFRSAEVDFAIESVQTNSFGGVPSSLLCVALHRLTGDPKWTSKQMELAMGEFSNSIDADTKQLIETAQRNIKSAVPLDPRLIQLVPIYLELMKVGTNVEQRADLLKRLHEYLMARKISASIKAVYFYGEPSIVPQLGEWDSDANAKFPEFWLENLRNTVRYTKRAVSAGGLLMFSDLWKSSPEACAILGMKCLLESPESRDMEVFLSSRQTCTVPRDFPVRCENTPGTITTILQGLKLSRLLLLAADRRKYQQWLDINKKTESFFIGDNIAVKRGVANVAISKATRQQWISDRDFVH